MGKFNKEHGRLTKSMSMSSLLLSIRVDSINSYSMTIMEFYPIKN